MSRLVFAIVLCAVACGAPPTPARPTPTDAPSAPPPPSDEERAAPASLDPSLAAGPPRVLEVARRIASGQEVEEVAADTGLTVKTVRTYLERAHACLGVRNRAELVRRVHGLA
jgi:DNA-binding NarL/FixJ family response regulator